MKLRYILPLTAISALLLSCAASAAELSVNIDDEPVNFPDVGPTIVNSRTYVPLRGVFTTLGYQIDWDGDEKTALLVKEDTTITASTTDLRITHNGTRRAAGDSAYPIIIDGRMLLPVRAISEATGCTVLWDEETKTVNIYTEDDTLSDYSNPNGRSTESEENYISKAYELCGEIKTIASKNNNQALLRFLDRGYTNTKNVSFTTADNARLKEIADTLYSLEPASGAAKLQPYFKEYADVLCSFIAITEDYDSGELTEEEALVQLDLLKEEKDDLAINFSVTLNDYFKEKNVFYEAVYDEYVLDMLK